MKFIGVFHRENNLALLTSPFVFDFLLTYIDVEFYQRETLQSLDAGKEIS